MLSWNRPKVPSTTSDRPIARVLIVDDEEPIRGLVERVLSRAGYETAVAADGVEALRIAEEKGPFDLLLADVVMPGMQGDELGRRLRASDPELKILYLTGYTDQLFTDRTLLWENEAFLEKPITVTGLLEAVSLTLFGHTGNSETKTL
jgi:two-component system, cell cycle sensor histidine kinase and response regulator CckA